MDRAISWVWRHVLHLLDHASAHAPGHGIGVAVVFVVAAAVLVAVLMRVGPLRRPSSSGEPILGGGERTASDYRKDADSYAASSQWALAVRERLRAVARELEERGVLDPRPGRTAAELCREASAQLPELAPDLLRATAAFDAIWYGGTTAGPADNELLRDLDRRLTGTGRLLTLGRR